MPGGQHLFHSLVKLEPRVELNQLLLKVSCAVFVFWSRNGMRDFWNV